jgi:hypothetical protein
MDKYKRVFVPNPSFRFDPTELNTLAESVVYVSDLPMFDNLIGDENVHRFEHKIAERMVDFDPTTDIIAYYGDSMIFAIMVMYLCDNHDDFAVARYSSKLGGYVIRELAYDKFL